MSQHRLVFTQAPERRHLRRTAYTLNWDVEEEYDRDPVTDQPYELVFVTGDQRTKISYIEDHICEMQYLLFRGRDIQREAAKAAKAFDLLEPADLPAAALPPATSDRARATLRVGLCAAYLPTQVVEEVAVAGLHASDPDVRAAAALAIAYAERFDLAPLLRAAAEREEDPKARRELSRLAALA